MPFEIVDRDECGMGYVVASFESREEAREALEDALSCVETLREERRIRGYLDQVADLVN
jgi:predicted RNase H-like HicB family nuclease